MLKDRCHLIGLGMQWVWKAKLAWVQDEEMKSYTLLQLISLSSVIYLLPALAPAFDFGSCITVQAREGRGNLDAQQFLPVSRHMDSWSSKSSNLN